jgi:hypothetical protein
VGLATPGSSEGDVPPSWGFSKGAGPLGGVGEAGFRAVPTREGGILEQNVDRPSGEPACLDAGPTVSRCVATALARSSALCMIEARRKNTAVDSAFRLRNCSRNVHE